ncbi:MAG: Hpt domain-containing protein [Magnetococcales bacterium]|nr:Hpt domain-containing protein [Magnetococcales bacterium]
MSIPSHLSTLEPSQPAIDPEALELLREDLDPEDLIRVVSLYLEKLPGRVAGILAACEQQDGAALAHIAHPMKSSSRQLGALLLGGLCERLEYAGRDQQVATVIEQLPALQQEVAVVQVALRWLIDHTVC